jgi:hypothetical protein
MKRTILLTIMAMNLALTIGCDRDRDPRYHLMGSAWARSHQLIDLSRG